MNEIECSYSTFVQLFQKINQVERTQQEIERNQLTTHEEFKELVELVRELRQEQKERFDICELLLRQIYDKVSTLEQQKKPEPSVIKTNTVPVTSNKEQQPKKRARRESAPSRSPSRRQDIQCPLCTRNQHDFGKCPAFKHGELRQRVLDQRKRCRKCAQKISHRICPNETKKCEFCPEYHLHALCRVIYPDKKKKKVKAQVLPTPTPPPPSPDLQSTVRRDRKRARSPDSQRPERRESERYSSELSSCWAPRPKTPPQAPSNQMTPERIAELLNRNPVIFQNEPQISKFQNFAVSNEFRENRWHTFSNFPCQPTRVHQVPYNQSFSTDYEYRGYFDVQDEPMHLKKEEPFEDSFQ